MTSALLDGIRHSQPCAALADGDTGACDCGAIEDIGAIENVLEVKNALIVSALVRAVNMLRGTSDR